MFTIKFVSSLLLILLGSMDCLTTIVGTLCFGTLELNPLIATLVNTNLPAFIAMKLAVTVSAGLIFVLAEKALLSSPYKGNRSFKIARNTLRISRVFIVLLLFFCRHKQHHIHYPYVNMTLQKIVKWANCFL